MASLPCPESTSQVQWRTLSENVRGLEFWPVLTDVDGAFGSRVHLMSVISLDGTLSVRRCRYGSVCSHRNPWRETGSWEPESIMLCVFA